MATPITNQATLTYRYGAAEGTASSNIATATLQGPLAASKNSLFTQYSVGDELTYTISVTNNSAVTISDIRIVDDLGTYTIAGPLSVTPLTYVGPANLYINGVFSAALIPAAGANSVTFTVPVLAPGSNAMIMYVAEVNRYALQDPGSILVNNAAITATGMTGEIFASYAVTAEAVANVSIIKSMSPGVITEGGTLTYTFSLYNYGNTPATDVVLTDAFDPAPSGITVSMDGAVIPAAEYGYTAGVLTLPAAMAPSLSIVIPAATFDQAPATGLVSTSPGVLTVTVSGSV